MWKDDCICHLNVIKLENNSQPYDSLPFALSALCELLNPYWASPCPHSIHWKSIGWMEKFAQGVTLEENWLSMRRFRDQLAWSGESSVISMEIKYTSVFWTGSWLFIYLHLQHKRIVINGILITRTNDMFKQFFDVTSCVMLLHV